MLLSYRDPLFWKKFQADHWQPRVPTVLKQPFKDFPFTETAVLRAMRSFEEGLQAGDQRIRCLVSVGDKEKPPRRPLRQLFRQPSATLKELEQSCARVFPKQKFGLMVTRFEAVDPEIWSALTAFLQDARHCIDFPVPRAFVDLFYGNYSSTFTGLHKDTQEIFAFVTRGEKRILAWPYDYFLPRVKGLSAGDRYFQMRLKVDPRKFRKDAVVLDAKAGDVLYWPSDYWHVAEPLGKSSAMVSLGIFRPEIAPAKLSPAQTRFREKLLSHEPAIPSQDVTEMMSHAEAAQQLRWVTGFGFELGGPVADTTRRKHDVQVVKSESTLILWKVDRGARRIFVAANGHSIDLPHSSKLVTLLERICRGESVSLSSKNSRGEGSSIYETHWSKLCELKTRKRVSKRDDGDSLVEWLLRVHAVEAPKH